MAYIPPHKRHLNYLGRPLPTPDLLVPRFQRNLNLRSSRSTSERRKDKNALSGGKIVYAMDSITRWWTVGLTDDDQFSSSVRLEPVSCESFERRRGEKPLTLVGDHPPKEVKNTTGSSGRSPWVSIAEKIQPDLLTSLQNVRNRMEFQESEEVKPSFVARFGKIFVHQSPSIRLDTSSQTSAVGTALNQVKRSFYTNIPHSYMESILNGEIPKLGVDFDEEKEYYHVKVLDKCRPDATLSCKCNVMEIESKLEVHKIELNPVRNLVVDMSCLDKNLDLRLMLSTKRTLKALTDNEMHGMRNLISSAIVDPDVKGGLRWPLGKESFGDRFSVVGVWHTKAKTFKNSSIRLKLRDADRFDFRTSTGEVAKEVNLKMTGVNAQLLDQIVEIGPVIKTLQDTLKMIWDHFLSCDDCSFP